MHGSLTIWFFIGILLIMGAGIYELYVPPVHPPVLSNLHMGIWWGAFLLAIGLFYFIKFYPKKS
jgi:hypothetical protein